MHDHKRWCERRRCMQSRRLGLDRRRRWHHHPAFVSPPSPSPLIASFPHHQKSPPPSYAYQIPLPLSLLLSTHSVQYRNGLYGNNSVTDGPAYRVREVYDVRVFILNDAQPGAPSSRAVTESAVTDEGYSFDYIDDTGPRNPDQATTPPGPPVIPN